MPQNDREWYTAYIQPFWLPKITQWEAHFAEISSTVNDFLQGGAKLLGGVVEVNQGNRHWKYSVPVFLSSQMDC